MSLSPIAQYCIRKLLRQNIEHLEQLLLPNHHHPNLSDEDFDRVLHQFYQSSKQQTFKIQELELLTNLHQQLERNQANTAALAEIKRRIFSTLGFTGNPLLPTQLPAVVAESAIEKFNFFHQGQVQEGMRHENQLFAAVYQFDRTQRLQAYQMAWALSEAKVPLLVSLSSDRFIIWINLQSPIYAVLVHQDVQLLRMILLLNLTLRKKKAIVNPRPPKLPRVEIPMIPSELVS